MSDSIKKEHDVFDSFVDDLTEQYHQELMQRSQSIPDKIDESHYIQEHTSPILSPQTQQISDLRPPPPVNFVSSKLAQNNDPFEYKGSPSLPRESTEDYDEEYSPVSQLTPQQRKQFYERLATPKHPSPSPKSSSASKKRKPYNSNAFKSSILSQLTFSARLLSEEPGPKLPETSLSASIPLTKQQIQMQQIQHTIDRIEQRGKDREDRQKERKELSKQEVDVQCTFSPMIAEKSKLIMEEKARSQVLPTEFDDDAERYELSSHTSHGAVDPKDVVARMEVEAMIVNEKKRMKMDQHWTSTFPFQPSLSKPPVEISERLEAKQKFIEHTDPSAKIVFNRISHHREYHPPDDSKEMEGVTFQPEINPESEKRVQLHSNREGTIFQRLSARGKLHAQRLVEIRKEEEKDRVIADRKLGKVVETQMTLIKDGRDMHPVVSSITWIDGEASRAPVKKEFLEKQKKYLEKRARNRKKKEKEIYDELMKPNVKKTKFTKMYLKRRAEKEKILQQHESQHATKSRKKREKRRGSSGIVGEGTDESSYESSSCEYSYSDQTGEEVREGQDITTDNTHQQAGSSATPRIDYSKLSEKSYRYKKRQKELQEKKEEEFRSAYTFKPELIASKREVTGSLLDAKHGGSRVGHPQTIHMWENVERTIARKNVQIATKRAEEEDKIMMQYTFSPSINRAFPVESVVGKHISSGKPVEKIGKRGESNFFQDKSIPVVHGMSHYLARQHQAKANQRRVLERMCRIEKGRAAKSPPRARKGSVDSGDVQSSVVQSSVGVNHKHSATFEVGGIAGSALGMAQPPPPSIAELSTVQPVSAFDGAADFKQTLEVHSQLNRGESMREQEQKRKQEQERKRRLLQEAIGSYTLSRESPQIGTISEDRDIGMSSTSARPARSSKTSGSRSQRTDTRSRGHSSSSTGGLTSGSSSSPAYGYSSSNNLSVHTRSVVSTHRKDSGDLPSSDIGRKSSETGLPIASPSAILLSQNAPYNPAHFERSHMAHGGLLLPFSSSSPRTSMAQRAGGGSGGHGYSQGSIQQSHASQTARRTRQASNSKLDVGFTIIPSPPTERSSRVQSARSSTASLRQQGFVPRHMSHLQKTDNASLSNTNEFSRVDSIPGLLKQMDGVFSYDADCGEIDKTLRDCIKK
ncbi:hypothetical protein ADUPG1_008328 [Aduncisulcus paluster]|uniref:Uncharacterized protein n=1 Tax=Aduncisulcus paluster TaxID=2918883 RepID=A0ABQ5KSV9_9EUKA|nr:hypothetical protein ADUPG1_008328 [Aduncisulcus paluster]